ncbi:Uncharacterised protein [Salmonella enterica subsp. enterica]|nr:Uncharacterised protein [Salmonella enterica subsp. enterica] [Salmonella enterica subsp. enterica serovar Florida]
MNPIFMIYDYRGFIMIIRKEDDNVYGEITPSVFIFKSRY